MRNKINKYAACCGISAFLYYMTGLNCLYWFKCRIKQKYMLREPLRTKIITRNQLSCILEASYKRQIKRGNETSITLRIVLVCDALKRIDVLEKEVTRCVVGFLVFVFRTKRESGRRLENVLIDLLYVVGSGCCDAK